MNTPHETRLRFVERENRELRQENETLKLKLADIRKLFSELLVMMKGYLPSRLWSRIDTVIADLKG